MAILNTFACATVASHVSEGQ